MISSEKTYAISNFTLQSKIQKLICFQYERYIVEHLQSKKNTQDFLSFDAYFESLEHSNWKEIVDKYPALGNHLHLQKSNLNRELTTILNCFGQDRAILREEGIIIPNDLHDIHIGVGDFHNGRSTAILELEGKEKLVFKPKQGRVTKAYNILLDWVNESIPLGDYKYEIVEGENYHWLQFIKYKECTSEADVQKYYLRAGVLLCITYLLNASDFHYENIIAHGASPVLIDHETVIQPKIDTIINQYFKKFGNEGEEDTLFSSFLLPNVVKGSGIPMGMSGFGYHEQTQYQSFQKVGINRFTKDWKIVMDDVTVPLYKQNIPMLQGERVYPHQYANEIAKGFENCYKILMHKRDFLLSNDSPLNAFNDATVRVIWRPTTVYANIQSKMRLPKNLKSEKEQERIVRKYLKYAFRNVPEDSKLWLIYEHEVTQMLKGDIPYFEINTSSKDLETEHGMIKDFFELSCMGNVERKLQKLSSKDLRYQEKLIKESLLR